MSPPVFLKGHGNRPPHYRQPGTARKGCLKGSAALLSVHLGCHGSGSGGLFPLWHGYWPGVVFTKGCSGSPSKKVHLPFGSKRQDTDTQATSYGEGKPHDNDDIPHDIPRAAAVAATPQFSFVQ